MTLPWREIERELEDYMRKEHKPDGDLSLNVDRDKCFYVYPCDVTEDGPFELNLSSLARRLADRLTLRLVEPATKSRDGAAKATCPNCGYAVPQGEIHTCL